LNTLRTSSSEAPVISITSSSSESVSASTSVSSSLPKSSAPNSLSVSASSSESSKGYGSSYEVAEMESFAAGFEGALNRMKVPLPAGRTYADTTTPKTYDIMVFESADNSIGSTNPVVAQAPMRVQQYVCMPVSAANKTKLKGQLDTLLGVTL